MGMDLKQGKQRKDWDGKEKQQSSADGSQVKRKKNYLETRDQDEQQIHGGCQNQYTQELMNWTE
jgi:hypothetical protein